MKTFPLFRSLTFLALLANARAEIVETDVLIFGATAGGVSAACTAERLGKKAVVTEFGKHVGGLTSGGLGWTDIGNKAAIGGFARDFYKSLGKHYGRDEAWWFEPHVAEKILRARLAEAKVPVFFEQRLASVKKDGARIVEITMENGNVFRAKTFIDSTYEGDLMARAGVKYMVGREANERFGETLNGVRGTTPAHQFAVKVDPYVTPGDPASGLLPLVMSEPPGTPGAGDAAVQAFNFRLCFTKNPANRKPIDPPAGYDPKRFELLGRYCEALAAAGKKTTLDFFLSISMVTPEKTDINNKGAISTDFIGENYAYPDADYATRAKIWQAHEDYIRGFLTFLATDPRVPENVRTEMQKWGLCKDEFQDTGGWPHALYVREARRMIGAYVMTEKNCRRTETPDDSAGLGAYNMDSHNCRRIVQDGVARNEGDVQVGVKPYPVSYRSIIPRGEECENLWVPVALSATHIAYGSIRMEPVFMILGQSAATAASMAIDDRVSAQKVDYAKLRTQLQKDGRVLEWSAAPAAPAPVRVRTGLVIDDADAQKSGEWAASVVTGAQQAGAGYIHDGNVRKGELSIRWTPDISEAGDYEIELLFPPNPNRATNAPVVIELPGKPAQTVKINQRAPGGAKLLGKFTLAKGKSLTVTLSNGDTDGYVVADGILLRKL